MINLELNRRDAIILRHHLFLYTKDHPGFFSDEGILKIREISQQIDKHLEEDLVSCNIDIDLKLNIHDAALFVLLCFNILNKIVTNFLQQEHQSFVISSDNLMNRLKQIFLKITITDPSGFSGL